MGRPVRDGVGPLTVHPAGTASPPRVPGPMFWACSSPSFCPGISPRCPKLSKDTGFHGREFTSNKPLPLGLSALCKELTLETSQHGPRGEGATRVPGQSWVTQCPGTNIHSAPVGRGSVPCVSLAGKPSSSIWVQVPRLQVEPPTKQPPLLLPVLSRTFTRELELHGTSSQSPVGP